jgi:asparagine synthase (glutamine-hydrolysing)
MCGITGYLDFNKERSRNQDIIVEMVQSMNHRGPDDLGVILKHENQFELALGQCRLSIIDLSSAGHQPMLYKHFVIVFNGEIYNYKEIRLQLENLGHSFKTETDTEVILQAFEEWGVKCVDVFIGMFAFLIYDEQNKKVFAFRDRVGVKPFYYYFNEGLFLFGSELKSLIANRHFPREIDLSVLPNYFQHGYIAAPYSIFKSTKKLLPGHFIELDSKTKILKEEEYWNLNDFF